MMPEAGRVIDAARRVVSLATTRDPAALADLEAALDALDAKLYTAGHSVSKVEQDRTWGEVVAGDDIQSPKTMGWFEVNSTTRSHDGQIKVWIKGAPKPIIRNPREAVRLRRGVEGDAVDILEVLFSGTTSLTHAPVTRDAGPMLTDKVEDDD